MSFSVKNVALVLTLASAAAAKEVGCFSDKGSLKIQGDDVFQSQGQCEDQCTKNGDSVAGLTKGNTCACGNEVPTSEELPKTSCGMPCTGYPGENCGGENAWLILSTGEEDSTVRTRSGKRDDDPTGEDEVNDADDADDNADDTDGGKDDSDPTGDDDNNNGNDKDKDDDKDGDDDNSSAAPSGTQAGNDGPSGTGSGSSPTGTGAGSRLSAGAVASLLAFTAFAIGM